MTPGTSCEELEQERKADYDQSERRIGITKEALVPRPRSGGDQLVGYMETSDFGKALSLFSASRDEFDMWFKRRLADSTGLDLNNPPPMQLPESRPATPHEQRDPRRPRARRQGVAPSAHSTGERLTSLHIYA